jgi:predicted nucleic acid-binding protein
VSYLIDTNVVSELRKVRSGRADAHVASWARGVSGIELHVSAVTVHELEHGVRLAEARDPDQGRILRAWMDGSVMVGFAGRIVPVDDVVARRAAALHVPDPAPYRNAFIGATALVHGMTLVTRNVRDFERFGGLAVLDPWEAGG